MPPAPVVPASTLSRARRVLAQHAGIALDARRDDALAAALEDLAGSLGLRDPDALLDACESASRPGPVDALACRLRTGETHVFRTREHFDALIRVVLPDLLRRGAEARTLRAWSAGCATGEETWSAAFALGEAAAIEGVSLDDWDVALLGTDIHEDALRRARLATYGEYSFRGVGAAERRRWFEPAEAGAWRVRAPWRSMARFERHDLVREPVPPAAIGSDLILCRNVLMYLTPEAARGVLERLVEALAPGGWLLVGVAEHGLVRDLPLELHALPDAMLYRRATGPIEPVAPRAVASLPVRETWTPSPPRETAPRPAREAPEDEVAAAVAAFERDHADVSACLKLGALAADRGRPLEAQAWLARVLHLQPGHAEALYLLALLAAQRGDVDGALGLVEQALGGGPESVMPLQLAARLRRERGDAAGAERALRAALLEVELMAPEAAVPMARDVPAGHLRSVLLSLLRAPVARRVRP